MSEYEQRTITRRAGLEVRRREYLKHWWELRRECWELGEREEALERELRLIREQLKCGQGAGVVELGEEEAARERLILRRIMGR